MIANAEELKSKYLEMKTMKHRFRMELSFEKTCEELLAAVMVDVDRRQRNFVFGENLDAQISQMAKWLTTDSPKFTLLLCGQCGNGKTTLLRAFQSVLNRYRFKDYYNHDYYGIEIINAIDLANMCRDSHPRFVQKMDVELLGVDDLGVEPREIMVYGNTEHPLIQLLTRRYEKSLFTIITTNLPPAQIHDLYGRVSSFRFKHSSHF